MRQSGTRHLNARRNKHRRGQAILEYILLVLMIAVTMAAIIRNVNQTIYGYWTGLVRQVASPCPDCETPGAPDLNNTGAEVNPVGAN